MNDEKYDSTKDTKAHIARVQQLLDACIDNLDRRALRHDKSKLESPEKEAFDVLTPQLKGLTYGSEEYRAYLRQMKPALQHHYANNSHHPEHYPENGVAGMSLLDVLEMLCDWKAAGERHADGNVGYSITHNTERFKLDPQLVSILRNTVVEMGWA